MDYAILQGTISSLHSALQVSKTLVDFKTTTDLEVKTIELREAIISAQQSATSALMEQAQMVERIRELEKEVTKIKAWEETKERYQLTNPWNGCFVFSLKETCKGTEPAHWICAHCYEDRRREILQIVKGINRAFYVARCNHCSSEMEMRDSKIRPQYAK